MYAYIYITARAPLKRVLSLVFDMGYNRGFIFSTAVALLTVLVAIYYRRTFAPENIVQERLRTLIYELEKLENSHSITSRLKVAVGYGVCTDVFVKAEHLLKYTEDVGQPEHFKKITTELELLKNFAYYFRHGAAAERYMPNETLFNELVAKARSYPSSYSTIGGNAAIMAMRFAKEGCDVTLAAKLTKSMYQMMPQVINIVGGEVKQDDIHLIMEYKRGDVWGPYSSVRANRYIIHSDTSNPMIRSLDPFDEFLSVTEPNLIVVSGLQMMDNYPFLEGERQKLLLKVKKQLLERPLSTKIHFEMASIVENEFFYELIESVLPYVDSLGVNEQEIASLKEFVVGGLSNVADSMPNVTVVLDQMRMVFELIRLKNIVNSSPRKLSRIHVHSLAYQVIFIEKGSEWKNTMAAAAKASLTAHRHVCATNHVDVKKAALMLDDRFLTSVKDGTEISLDINKPVSCWDEVLSGVIEKIPIQICVAPGLVCTETAQTAGGGDNISSAGLVLQV